MQVVFQLSQQTLEHSTTSCTSSTVKKCDLELDRGNFMHTSSNQACLPIFTYHESDSDQDVVLETAFGSLYAQWLKVSQENVALLEENMLMKAEIQYIKEKLVWIE